MALEVMTLPTVCRQYAKAVSRDIELSYYLNEETDTYEILEASRRYFPQGTTHLYSKKLVEPVWLGGK